MATAWFSAYDMHKVKAKKYLYFVQAVESQFHTNNLLADIAEFTYTMPSDILLKLHGYRDILRKNIIRTASYVLMVSEKIYILMMILHMKQKRKASLESLLKALLQTGERMSS